MLLPSGGVPVNVNDYLRLIAGAVVLISLVLAVYVHINFLYLTGFVALNLMQSAFTKWCPMMTILRYVGVKD